MELAFTDGFNESRSLPSMNRQCTGWYPKFIENGDAVEKRLYGTPGQVEIADTGSEPNRGSAVMADVPYFVNGTSLYRLNADYTTTTIGTIGGFGRVSMPNNGTQLMILIPGGAGYIYDKDTVTLTTITATGFTDNGAPQIAIFIDGYFMVNTDSKKFIVSGLNDGLTWDPLDFGSAESDPDIIVSLVNFRNEAYILGSQTVEAFTNVGGADFPFQRNGLILDKGCAAPFSIVATAGTFMFIGAGVNEEPSIYSVQGTQLVRISNDGVDLLLSGLSAAQMAQVNGYTYAQDSSVFACWEFPSETVVYGLDTGKWHKRTSQVTDAAGAIRTVGWRSTALVAAYGNLICFDTQDGRVGEVGLTTYDEYGEDIHRVFDVTPLRAGKAPLFIPRIEVTVEAGVGNTAAPNPFIRMSTSRDGQSFGGERQRSMGAQGEFNQRSVWRRNGRFPQYAHLRFLLSDQVRPIIVRVDAEIGIGVT